MAFDLGDVVPLSIDTVDSVGNPADVGSMTLTITLPDDSVVTQSALAPIGAGIYRYGYTTTQEGRHLVRWVGSGANATAYTDVFDVRAASPSFIVSLAKMKDQLHITTTEFDEDLRDFIESATRAVEKIRNETVIRRTFTDEIYLPEYYRGIGQVANAAMPYGIDRTRFHVSVAHTPALSLTSVARVDNTMTWDVTNLHLDPDGIIDVLFGPALIGHIAVIYVAGYRIIPESYTKAGEFIVQHLWQTRRGTKGSPRTGGMDTTTVPGLGFAVPNQAIELLGAGLPGTA